MNYKNVVKQSNFTRTDFTPAIPAVNLTMIQQ